MTKNEALRWCHRNYNKLVKIPGREWKGSHLSCHPTDGYRFHPESGGTIPALGSIYMTDDTGWEIFEMPVLKLCEIKEDL